MSNDPKGSNWWESADVGRPAAAGHLPVAGQPLPASPASAPRAEWFYSTTGSAIGPVVVDELRRLFSIGSLRPEHHVRHETWDSWFTVAESASTIGVVPAASARPPIDPGRPAPARQPAEWFYSTTGSAVGPVVVDELRRLFSIGSLRPEHHVRHETWDSWFTVAESATMVGLGDVASAVSSSVEPVGSDPAAPAVEPVGSDAAVPAVETAPFPQRLVSWLIDGTVLVLALVLFNRIAGAGPAWSTLLVVATYVGYTFGLRLIGHDTLGHLIVGLRVREAAEGGEPSRLGLAVRSSVIVLLALPLLLPLIGSFLGAHADPRARAWHDLASGTVVVKARSA